VEAADSKRLKDDLKNRKMEEAANGIRRGIEKRQEALERFLAKRKAFFISKEKITREIEEARALWHQTLKQLPKQPFGE
jgi:hypothetical protein